MFRSDEVMARSAWITMMGLVEIGVGHRMVSWFFCVLPFRWIFIFIFIFIFFNMGFCFCGILAGSGQWWCGGHVEAAWVSDRWLGYFRHFSGNFLRPGFQIGGMGF